MSEIPDLNDYGRATRTGELGPRPSYMQTEGRGKTGKKNEMSTSFPLLLSHADSSSDKQTRIRLLTIHHGMMRYNDAATVNVVIEIEETCQSAVPG
jgi:hypothetical protein